jgi:membrane-bound lytic murein transglycosylase B
MAPAADPVAAAADRLSRVGLKPDNAALYLRAQAATGTPWELLAAVHKVETGQRGSTTVTSSAGAQGPMQFMPVTFRAYAMDGDGDGAKTITDLDDAVMSAGRYLAAGGADKGRYSAALYNYNHSHAYVSSVLGITHKLGL